VYTQHIHHPGYTRKGTTPRGIPGGVPHPEVPTNLLRGEAKTRLRREAKTRLRREGNLCAKRPSSSLGKREKPLRKEAFLLPRRGEKVLKGGLGPWGERRRELCA